MFRIPSIKLTACNKTIETSKYRIHYQRPCGGGDRLGALAFTTGTATTTSTLLLFHNALGLDPRISSQTYSAS